MASRPREILVNNYSFLLCSHAVAGGGDVVKCSTFVFIIDVPVHHQYENYRFTLSTRTSTRRRATAERHVTALTIMPCILLCDVVGSWSRRGITMYFEAWCFSGSAGRVLKSAVIRRDLLG